MYDSHEKLEQKPKPERTATDIEESNALLGELYNFAPPQEQAEVSNDETEGAVDGMDVAPSRPTDSRKIEGAMSLDARNQLGETRSERQQDLRGYQVSETNGDSPHVRAHDEDVRRQTQEVKNIIDGLGIDTVGEAGIEARKIAQEVQNTIDGKPATDNGHMTTKDMNTVRRTAIATEVLEDAAKGNTEVFNRLDNSTAQRVISWQGGAQERGGADQMSNNDLEYLGKKVEEGEASGDSGETVSFLGEDGQIHRVEKNNHDRTLAEDWMNGNWSKGGHIDHATRDQVYGYLETVRERVNMNDPHERQKVTSKIAHMIANARYDSDRKKMEVGDEW